MWGKGDDSSTVIPLRFFRGNVQAACSSLVHCGQRVALTGMAETQKGQFLVVGSSAPAGSSLQRRLARLTMRKMTKATMRKLMMSLMNWP